MLNAWNQGINPGPSVCVTSHVCCRKWLCCGLRLKVIERKYFCDLIYFTEKVKEMQCPQQSESVNLTEPHQPPLLVGNRDRGITWGEIFRRLGPRKASTYQKIGETIIVGITVHKFSKFLDAYPNENWTSEPSEVCLPPLITSLGDNVSEMEHCHRTAVSHC